MRVCVRVKEREGERAHAFLWWCENTHTHTHTLRLTHTAEDKEEEEELRRYCAAVTVVDVAALCQEFSVAPKITSKIFLITVAPLLCPSYVNNMYIL